MPTLEYAAGAREQWYEWREKNEPTHDKAIAIVARELGRTNGLGIDYAVPDEEGRIDERLSFLVWDLTENGRGALDYDKQDGFIRNLLEQARMYVGAAYARNSVKIGKCVYTFPDRIRTEGRGKQRLADATEAERRIEAERMIRVAKATILRWKMVDGCDWKFIRGVLMRLYREVRAEWKKK